MLGISQVAFRMNKIIFCENFEKLMHYSSNRWYYRSGHLYKEDWIIKYLKPIKWGLEQPGFRLYYALQGDIELSKIKRGKK